MMDLQLGKLQKYRQKTNKLLVDDGLATRAITNYKKMSLQVDGRVASGMRAPHICESMVDLQLGQKQTTK